MLVKLHKRKKSASSKNKKAIPLISEPWVAFTLFVDVWRLSYPKKAARAPVLNAIKDFIRGKEQWTIEQVKVLEQTITAHTTAYINSFGSDFTYMVSPVNYFASEKWTERVSLKQDRTDVNSKSAGAPAKPNMPKITTIKAGEF